MKIIKLMGGLGNQMFQYAFYIAQSSQYKHIYYDANTLYEEMQKMGRGTIFDCFTLEGPKRTLNHKIGQRCISLLHGKHPYFFSKLFRKAHSWHNDTQVEKYLVEEATASDGYYEGYWQSEKYFDGCQEKVRAAFQIKNPLPEQSEKYLSMIRNEENPVSIHLRLGDYLTPENKALFGNICTEYYYFKAISYIQGQIPNAKFFIFSNDIEQAKSLFSNYNCVFVEGNDEKNGWADMYLMSQCKHNIIANSSFSWWGAWLNVNPAKIVTAPQRWLNTSKTPDICPDDWIRI